ncbi:MAG: hypothetical protein RLN72_12165 [Henriciella sp.]
MRWFAILLIAAWMLFGGAAHMIVPQAFYPIVPDWMPELWVVWISGLVELAIGIGVLIPRTRGVSGLVFAGLCLCFLPLHVWDFFRPDPVFPVPWGAGARIIVQLGLIALGLWLWRRESQPAGAAAESGDTRRTDSNSA